MLHLHVSVICRHGNTERESYYHQPFNLLPASPGSRVTAVVSGSLPFILLPSLLAPELLSKRCGRTQREESGISQTPPVCQVDPSRKITFKPICRSRTSCSERQITRPVHQLTGGGTRMKSWASEYLLFLLLPQNREGCAESPPQHLGSSLIFQMSQNGSPTLLSAV